MPDQEHTKEPWHSSQFYDPNRDSDGYDPYTMSAEDYYRAEACVSALAGIPDPAAFVAAALDALHFFRWTESVVTCPGYTPAEKEAMLVPAVANKVIDGWPDILTAAKGATP